MNALRLFFPFLFVHLFFFISGSAQSSKHRKEAWIAQYSLDKVLNSNGYTLVTGDFLYQVSRYTGSGIPVHPVNSNTDYSWPTINGTVLAAVSDGQGGWYVGGTFDFADTVAVTNLVHIKSDKTVDRTWKPNPNQTVRALTIHNNVLYVGGSFSKLSNQTRNFIGAIDLNTGNLSTWNPTSGGTVYALEVFNNILYAGGSFNSMGGLTRNKLAAIDLSTGVPTGWAPVVNSTVYSLSADNETSTIFIGGAFSLAGGASRTGVARINTTDGLATLWEGNLSNGGVARKIILNGGKLFVAGEFTTLSGVTRNGIGALDISKNSGNALNWNPDLTDGSAVYALGISNNALYFAGYFDSVKGEFRAGAAAVNINNATLISSWHPVANGDINTIAVAADAIFIGGSFNGINATERTDVAIFPDSTNEPVPFNLDFSDGRINAMVVKENTMYIGGEFSSVNGMARKNLVAINLADGAILDWAPVVEGVSSTDIASVNSMEISNDILYIGGRFMNIKTGATAKRANLASLRLDDGEPTSWNPVVGDGLSTSEFVNSLDVNGTTVYFGGNFTKVNSISRTAVAAVSVSSGALTTWAPEIPLGMVSKIQVSGNTAYVLGNFRTTVGGAVRTNGIAGLDLTTSMATSLNPQTDGYIYDFALNASFLFIGGDFSLVDFKERPYIASYDLATQTLTSWHSDIRRTGEAIPQVFSLAASSYRLYAGGWFEYLDYENRNNYAEYDLCPSAPQISVVGTTLHAPLADSYQWYENDQLVEGANSQTYEVNVLEYGKYAVDIASNGCTVRSNDYIYLVTGTESNTKNVINVFPNPSAGLFYLEVRSAGEMVVFDVAGNALQRNALHSGSNIIETAYWNPGAYMLQVRSAHATETVKIIKTH